MGRAGTAACSYGKPGVSWESLAAWLALAIQDADAALHPEEHVISKGGQGFGSHCSCGWCCQCLGGTRITQFLLCVCSKGMDVLLHQG